MTLLVLVGAVYLAMTRERDYANNMSLLVMLSMTIDMVIILVLVEGV